MYYVYLLRLENGEVYTGYSKHLRERIARHMRGTTKFTTDHPPKALIFYAAFEAKQLALSFERYLKSSSGKAFRNKHLVDGRGSVAQR